MGKYRVETTNGVYEIETEDAPAEKVIYGPKQTPAAAQPQAAAPSEPPSAMSRFLSSLGQAVNPIPAIQEFIDRPTQTQAMSAGLTAGMQSRGRQRTPEELAAIERGFTANVGPGPGPPVVPAGTEPLAMAGTQARQGDIAGATGTVTGAYGVLPAATYGLVKGGRTVAMRTAQGMRRGALSGGYPIATDPAIVDRAAATMGEMGVPFSPEGGAEVRGQGRALQAKKMGIIGEGTAAGKTVHRQGIIDDLLELRKQREKQFNPTEDVNQINALIDKIRNNLPADIPVELAEQLKEGTYKFTTWKPGDMPKGSGTVAGEKTAALSAKRHLETVFPELKDVNLAQQRGIELEPMLKLAVNKYVNRGKFLGNLKRQMLGKEGISIGGLAGAAGYAAHDPVTGIVGGLSADFMNAVLSDPKVKTWLAFQISQAQKLNPAKYGAASIAVNLNRVEEYRKSLEAEQAK